MTGTQFVAGNDTERRIKLKYNYMITCDWKAEMNLRTPKTRSGITGIGPTDFHGSSKVAAQHYGNHACS